MPRPSHRPTRATRGDGGDVRKIVLLAGLYGLATGCVIYDERLVPAPVDTDAPADDRCPGDADCDGIADRDEVETADPADADGDGDGVSDVVEPDIGGDPA